jgi:hypothetical protein
MKLNGFSRMKKEALSFANLKENVDAVCRSLLDGSESMSMKKKMSLCQQLKGKLVVEGHKVEIHYRFPASSDSNRERQRPHFFM